jgi:hypothetical protein
METSYRDEDLDTSEYDMMSRDELIQLLILTKRERDRLQSRLENRSEVNIPLQFGSLGSSTVPFLKAENRHVTVILSSITYFVMLITLEN